MVIEKIIISNEPPAVKNVIWGKPINNGFMLYYNNGGWKPLRADISNTITAVGNTLIYKDDNRDNPLVVEGQDVEYSITCSVATTSQPADGDIFDLGEEIIYDVSVENSGNIPIKDASAEGSHHGMVVNFTGTIAPGETKHAETSYTVTIDDLAQGSVSLDFYPTAYDCFTGTNIEDFGGSITTGHTEDPVKSLYINVAVTDVGTGEFAGSGCHLQVIDSDSGAVVDEWDDDSHSHMAEGILLNTEYILRMTVPPENGYILAQDETFTITSDGVEYSGPSPVMDGGSPLYIEMQPVRTTTRISVVDVASGEELEGTHLTILDSSGDPALAPEGEPIEGWDSTIEPWLIEGLLVGEEYTIRVETPTEGYFYSSAESIFTIDEENSITTTLTTTTDEYGNTIIMVEMSKTIVYIQAVDEATGDYVEGIQLRLLDADGNIVDEWQNTEDYHEIWIEKQDTYYLYDVTNNTDIGSFGVNPEDGTVEVQSGDYLSSEADYLYYNMNTSNIQAQ